MISRVMLLGLGLLPFLHSTAGAYCDSECMERQRNWSQFQKGCKDVEKRFQGHLIVTPESTEYINTYRCTVTAVNWDALKIYFGIERVKDNALLVLDKNEDWQIAPGLMVSYDTGGSWREPLPLSFARPHFGNIFDSTLSNEDHSEDSLFGKARPVTADSTPGNFKNPVALLAIAARAAVFVWGTMEVGEKLVEMGQVRARVDDTRRKEYEAASTYGMDSTQREEATKARVQAEDDCKHCYNSSFEMRDGVGYHFVGLGRGFGEDEHEPSTYDFVVRHYGSGPNYVMR